MRRTPILLGALAVAGGIPGPAGAQDADAMNPPSLRFSGESVTLSMSVNEGRRLVEAFVGSRGPYTFLLDTGARATLLDAGIASELGLEEVGLQRVGSPAGGAVDARIVAVPVLQVGEIEIRDLNAVAIDLDSLGGGLMDGILGMEIFRNVLLTLDPIANEAVVSRERLSPDDPSVIPLTRTEPLLSFEIDVAGHRIPAHLDTGSPDGFTLPTMWMEVLPTRDSPERRAQARLIGATQEIRSRQLDGEIRFGEITHVDPWVSFMFPSLPETNIGSRVLDRVITRIDQASSLIGFTPVESSPEVGASPRRVGLQLGGPGFDLSHVGMVMPRSLAERAGLQAGDEVVTLNGRPISGYDAESLGELLGGPEPLAFEVEREGDRIVVRIP